MEPKLRKLIVKTAFFALSLSVAWWLIKSGYFYNLTLSILPVKFVAEVVAGIFYTSFLTSPVSLAMLVVLAQESNPIQTALLAGLGAAFGDFLIVKFFRKGFSSELHLVSKELHLQEVNKFLQKLHMEFITPLAGAVIIASPFPDELGIMMLGISKLRYREIAILTYILNTAGILLIVLPINLLS